MSITPDWGLCIQCKWWQVEPDATLEKSTHGLCIDERLQAYRLRVSGGSGCNQFANGVPARASGSGTCPPVAQPVR